MAQNTHRKKSSPKKKKNSIFKFGCFIAFIMLIPVFYGLYLYSRQYQNDEIQPPKKTIVNSYHISPNGDLEIAILTIPREEQIIRHTGYNVSYNNRWKLPNWVSYELTREETQGVVKRSNHFIKDPLVKGAIATNEDYAHSGYDKGHMAPAADMKWSQTAMKESFYFSNMCPQHPQLNRKGWKNLEDKIRNWAIADSAIIIICGPIVKEQPLTIGRNQIAVPECFFKIVLAPFAKPARAIGFLFKNEQAIKPLSTYVVTVDSIETLTGIDFFSSLPDNMENIIEAHADLRQWQH